MQAVSDYMSTSKVPSPIELLVPTSVFPTKTSRSVHPFSHSPPSCSTHRDADHATSDIGPDLRGEGRGPGPRPPTMFYFLPTRLRLSCRALLNIVLVTPNFYSAGPQAKSGPVAQAGIEFGCFARCTSWWQWRRVV